MSIEEELTPEFEALATKAGLHTMLTMLAKYAAKYEQSKPIAHLLVAAREVWDAVFYDGDTETARAIIDSSWKPPVAEEIEEEDEDDECDEEDDDYDEDDDEDDED